LAEAEPVECFLGQRHRHMTAAASQSTMEDAFVWPVGNTPPLYKRAVVDYS
jgi:hypothetical protein